MRFNCDCKYGSLVKTDNQCSFNGITYDVYICEECKRYYARRFNHLVGIEFGNIAQVWKQNDIFIPNVW